MVYLFCLVEIVFVVVIGGYCGFGVFYCDYG